jgi:hypothetical protein
MGVFPAACSLTFLKMSCPSLAEIICTLTVFDRKHVPGLKHTSSKTVEEKNIGKNRE